MSIRTVRCEETAASIDSGTPPSSWHPAIDRKSTRLNSSHSQISYAVFCLKKKKHRHVGTSNCKNESDHGQENLDGLLIGFAQTLNSLRGTEGQNVFLRLWVGSAQADRRGALKDRI